MTVAEKRASVVEIPPTVNSAMINLEAGADLEIAGEPSEYRGKWLFVGTERMPVPGLLWAGEQDEFEAELDYGKTLFRLRQNYQPEPTEATTVSDQLYRMANANRPKALVLTSQNEAGEPCIRHFEIVTGSGRVVLRRLAKAEATVRAHSSSVEATDLQMRKLKVKTGLNGEIILNDVTSESLRAETSRGVIEVNGGGNSLSHFSQPGGWLLESYDGDIIYNRMPKGVVRATSNMGRIVVVNPA